jgi:hypothetical protein
VQNVLLQQHLERLQEQPGGLSDEALQLFQQMAAFMEAQQQQVLHMGRLLAEAGVTDTAAARQARQRLEEVAEGSITDAATVAATMAATRQDMQEMRDQLTTMAAEVSTLRQQVAKDHATHTVAVHAPSSAGLDDVVQAVARAAKVAVKGARCVHRARGSAAAGATAVGQAAAAPAGGSAGASSSSSGSSSRGFDVLVLELRSQADVRAVLSGNTRMALKRAGLPYYVDDNLSYAERQQRRQLQPLRRQLRAQGKKTRWAKAQLQQRVQDAQGRWSWQQVAYPPAPGDGETEEGEVVGDGQLVAGGGNAMAVDAAAP